MKKVLFLALMLVFLWGCGKQPPVETEQTTEATEIMVVTEAAGGETVEATIPVPETGGGEIQMGPEETEKETTSGQDQSSSEPEPTQTAPVEKPTEGNSGSDDPEWTPPKL